MYPIKPSVVSILAGVAISMVVAWGAGPAYAAPAITSPAPGSTLSGATETFSWTAGGTPNIIEWWLYVGTTGVGSNNLYNSSTGTATSAEVSGLPTNGSTVYVRLYWLISGQTSWARTDYTYTAFTSGGGGADNHTLRWDRILDSTNGDAAGCNSDRFKCVMGGAAVVDLETGLVWDRSPDITTGGTWTAAITHCAQRTVGGRIGWELPMRNQLASLVDRDNSSPALPTGHPFLTVQPAFYWSATAGAVFPSDAWFVDFTSGGVVTGDKDDGFHAWCVRGGQSFDGNTHDTLH